MHEGDRGLMGSTIKKWASRSAQALVLMMVLVQNPSSVPAAQGEKLPVVEPGDGRRRDEGAAVAAATISLGQDFPRSQNRLRREEYPSSRGSRQRHQQLQAEQERTPYAQVSSTNHRNMKGWGREHRKLEGITESLPHMDQQLSVEPDMLQDGNRSLRQINRALRGPPINGSCPVAAHRSNSAVIREDRLDAETPTVIFGTSNVWARLQQAATIPSQQRCPSPPCCRGTHVHTYRGGDLGEEMSHVQGAVVVRRPDLARAPVSLAPAHDVDFVETFQSYFLISQSSLLRQVVEADGFNLTSTTQHVKPAFAELRVATDFFGAVREGNPAAAELLTPYCSGEDPRQDISDCVRIPTLVSMANVYINQKGAVWNENDYIFPVNCDALRPEYFLDAQAIVTDGSPNDPLRYGKVFVISQDWGPNYYHFTVEHLPRITLALDILLENPEIKIAVHRYQHDHLHGDLTAVREVHMEMLEILGISRDRVIFAHKQIHAELAIVPTTTNCGDPDPNMVNMLRNRFLQGLFPTTNGVPPTTPRPVIVLVVRNNLRGLTNNDEVKEALQINFPSFSVVEFFGNGSVRDQFKTFATAAMIIAPHGAGLANMIVAPLHTPVLEIGALACPPCFLRLALKLHHIYARHPGDDWSQECHTWYEPDVEEIVDLVRDLLKAKRQAGDALVPPQVAFADEKQP
ncbi:unnamed protein product [Ectocarpus sp. 4 AP-2014]